MAENENDMPQFLRLDDDNNSVSESRKIKIPQLNPVSNITIVAKDGAGNTHIQITNAGKTKSYKYNKN